MDRKMKKILCCAVALIALLLTACRPGGGKTTEPNQTMPSATTLPQGEGVEEWEEPDGTEPVQPTEPQDTDTEPSAGATESPADPTEPSVSTQSPGETDPTQPSKETDPAQSPGETEPQPTERPVTGEPPATTEPQVGGRNPADVTYEEYLAMSPYEQQAHYEQFSSLEAYIAWHNAALAEYEENQGSIEVTGGIDIGDFMNP